MPRYPVPLLFISVVEFLISITAAICSISPWVWIIGVVFGISYVHLRNNLQPRRANIASPTTPKFADLETCKSIVSGSILRHGSYLTFLQSRAIPNERLVDSFGIENSFTSMDEAYCKKFREKAANLLKVKERDWKNLMGSVEKIMSDGVKFASHNSEACLQLVPFVQITVFRSMLLLVFPQNKTQIDVEAVAVVTDKINSLWIASKKAPPSHDHRDRDILGRALWRIFPDADQTPRGNPLNLILPSYETMWRVVLYCFLEVMYRGGNERRSWQHLLTSFAAQPTKSTFQAFHAGTSVQHIVQETLRLYPPTKSIYRAVNLEAWDIWPDIIAADIMALHRDPRIWGTNSLLFEPMRWAVGTEKQRRLRQDAFMPFGCLPNICPAKEVAPIMIGILVAALVGETQDQFELFALRKSDGIGDKAPMSLERYAYGSLRLRRIV